jgi:hypothetical protein
MVTPSPADNLEREVRIEFDPVTASTKVLLVVPEPGTEDEVEAEDEIVVEAETEPETNAGSESESSTMSEEPADPASAPKGSNASRRNALKDGLSATVVFTPELEVEVARWTALLTEVFQPADDYEIKLIEEMGRTSAQLEEISKRKVLDHTRCMDRAHNHWDEDRRKYVCELGERLHKNPYRVAEALRRTKQGLDWLLEHWDTLSAILKHGGEWDEKQRQFAYDLLGVHLHLRPNNPLVPAGTDGAGLAARVAAEIAHLETLRAIRLEQDETDQRYAVAGMPVEEDSVTRTLRRKERDARRDYNQALHELFRVRAEAETAAAQAKGNGLGGAAGPAASSTSAGFQPRTRTRTDAPIPSRRPMSAQAVRFATDRDRMQYTATVVPAEPAPAATVTTTTTTPPRSKAEPRRTVRQPDADEKRLPRRVRKEMAKKARQAARQKARQAARQQAR